MLSKEEIEKAKERISKSLEDVWFGTLYSQEENDEDEKTLLQYIQELETEKQKLIDILEKANEKDTESVKYYERVRRKTTSDFYKKSYQTTIHKLNAKRETRRSILKIMKGEK